MITFFEGRAPVDFIKNRLHAIVAANPWLAGRLVSEQGSIKVRLPTKGFVTESDHFVNSSIEVNPNMEYSKLCEACEDILVTDNARLNQFNRNVTLFRVSICPSGLNGFAVIVSVSHVIADGKTCYLIAGMLGEGGQVKELPGRLNVPDGWCKEEKKSMVLAFGPEKTDWLFSKMRIGGILRDSLTSRVSRNIKAAIGFINTDWVDEVKSQYIDEARAAGYPFLSTNDVVASWMAVTGGYTHMDLYYDFRVVDGPVNEEFAGGYAVPICLASSSEFGSPIVIREAVAATRSNTPTKQKNVPSAWDALLRDRFCFSTNWVKGFIDMQLPGCRRKVHMPLMRPNLSGLQVIFQATKERVGMLLIAGTSDMDKLLISDSIPYKELLCKGNVNVTV